MVARARHQKLRPARRMRQGGRVGRRWVAAIALLAASGAPPKRTARPTTAAARSGSAMAKSAAPSATAPAARSTAKTTSTRSSDASRTPARLTQSPSPHDATRSMSRIPPLSSCGPRRSRFLSQIPPPSLRSPTSSLAGRGAEWPWRFGWGPVMSTQACCVIFFRGGKSSTAALPCLVRTCSRGVSPFSAG